MSKKMKRSPFLLGFSGSGIPSPGTILKYLGLRQGKKKGRSIDNSAVSNGCTLPPAHCRSLGHSYSFPLAGQVSHTRAGGRELKERLSCSKYNTPENPCSK